VSRLPPPPPPGLLALVPPAWRLLPAGSELWRIYRAGGAHPQSWNGFRSWGPHADARFDHHEPPPREQTRGVLYGALDVVTCVAEVFQRTNVVARSEHAPYLAAFALAGGLRLLDLAGPWPTIAGASMALNSALDRALTQAWSRAVYLAYPDADGLWYPSSMHANRPAVVLYERAAAALPAAPVLNRALADPALDSTVVGAAHAVGYAIGP
jgi:hypothetical protein